MVRKVEMPETLLKLTEQLRVGAITTISLLQIFNIKPISLYKHNLFKNGWKLCRKGTKHNWIV